MMIRHVYVIKYILHILSFTYFLNCSFQTEDLQQYVLTNRCTEPRSSVVPHVICVNEISTVNVIVLNLETGDIEPAFINVESCRAKYVE